jgi:23S rRNA pseudouridine1911/1915/1917 synthase
MLRRFRRQALHATRLSFAHPASGETLSLEAPLPGDLEQLLAVLREDAQ